MTMVANNDIEGIEGPFCWIFRGKNDPSYPASWINRGERVLGAFRYHAVMVRERGRGLAGE